MQVSVESTSALERRVTFQVPSERVDQEVKNRLQNLSKSARIDGFRPGKVPLKVIDRKFGKQVRAEVIEQIMRSALDEALTEHKLQPVSAPKFEFPEQPDGQETVESVATFEVFPEIVASGVENIKVDKPVVEIVEQDVDQMLAKLQKQRITWQEANRPAAMEDKVVVDFEGSIDGESFAGGKGSSVSIELGSNMFIPGFEEQLVGISAGEERTISVTFPADYHAKELAGKTASFKVVCHKVVEPSLPKLDEEFARALGVVEGGIEQLRDEVRRNMERELEQAVRVKLKDQIFAGLLEENPFEVPASMVEEEQKRLLKEANEASSGAVDMEHGSTLFADQASRRVKLGLLVNEIVRANEIALDHARVRSTVESVASSYENPDEVVAWYYQNQDVLSGIQAVVIEDQVVDWLLENVKIKEKPLGFYELLDSATGARG